VPAIVHDVLNSPGQPLDGQTRAFIEPHFGQDLGHVRVHTGPQAAESAREIKALAYTVGRDIVFGDGQYAPGTYEGKRLLAHELAHVAQNSQSVQSAPLSVSEPGNRFEQQADWTAEQVMGGSPVETGWQPASAPAGLIQRHPDAPCPAPPQFQSISARPRAIWGPANDAIEQAYKDAHSGNVILTGRDFDRGEARLPRGAANRREGDALLARLRGIQNQRRPDIMDFTARVFYEIKTPGFANAGMVQLESYYVLTSALQTQIGGLAWNQDLATWYPPHNLSFPGNPDRTVCTEATNYAGPSTGLILYQVLETSSRRRRGNQSTQPHATAQPSVHVVVSPNASATGEDAICRMEPENVPNVTFPVCEMGTLQSLAQSTMTTAAVSEAPVCESPLPPEAEICEAPASSSPMDGVPEGIPEGVPEGVPEGIPEGIPDFPVGEMPVGEMPVGEIPFEIPLF
jgi:hypothetical protein